MKGRYDVPINSLGDLLKKALGEKEDDLSKQREEVLKKLNSSLKEEGMFYLRTAQTFYDPLKPFTAFSSSSNYSYPQIAIPRTLLDDHYYNFAQIGSRILSEHGWVEVPWVVDVNDISDTEPIPPLIATRHNVLCLENNNSPLAVLGRRTILPINIKQALSQDEITIITKPIIETNKGYNAVYVSSNIDYTEVESLKRNIGEHYRFVLRISDFEGTDETGFYVVRKSMEGVREFFSLNKSVIFDENTVRLYVSKNRVEAWKERKDMPERIYSENVIEMLSKAYGKQIQVESMPHEMSASLLERMIKRMGKNVSFDADTHTLYATEDVFSKLSLRRFGFSPYDLNDIHGQRIEWVGKD